jgi:integrase
MKASRGRLFQRRSRLTGELLPTWWLAYRVDGAERRESTHTTDRDVAQKLLTKRLDQANEDQLPDPTVERLTVGALLDRLLDHYETKEHRSLATVRSQTKALREVLGRVLAREVTTARLVRLVKTWRAERTGPATCNRRVQLLRAAYRRAKVDPKRIDFGEVLSPEAPPRRALLDVAAFEAIHAQLPAHVRDYFAVAFLTGVRKAQLAKTTWPHYDPTTATFTWTAAEVKSKHPHVLPLDGRAREIIDALYATRRLHCRHVFHGRHCAPGRQASKALGCIGDIKKAWTKACGTSGYAAAVFHDTRRAAVTHLANAGVPAHEIMGISGHRTRSMLDRYSIGTEEQKRRALRRGTEYLEAERAKATATVQPIKAK